MINEAIELIVEKLNDAVSDGVEDFVVAGNIAFAEGSEEGLALANKIVLSLVNIDEESTMKNGHYFRKRADAVEYRNRPVNLNLYLLFSANFTNNYNDALAMTSRTIEFFQRSNTFTLHNTSPEGLDFQLVLDLHTITFEQVNYLWGSLGGKQYPFVLYKCRVVSIEAKDPVGSGALIEEIHSKEKMQ
ncbi:DUF4255 domain-containing protein [Flammeovirgaceae bacterium SG7u.111]|nr:DUF4255 domain-containing protein [Flammeovirgaceae bacterium SG7u.132]WPO36475.1 DUF4255 domain-containing protein [Flammeovirgaceae bacterium SG7u.111]